VGLVVLGLEFSPDSPDVGVAGTVTDGAYYRDMLPVYDPDTGTTTPTPGWSRGFNVDLTQSMYGSWRVALDRRGLDDFYVVGKSNGSIWTAMGSQDGGLTWTGLDGGSIDLIGDINSFVSSEVVDGQLLACSAYWGAHLSLDGGLSWIPLEDPGVGLVGNANISTGALASRSGGELMAVFQRNGGPSILPGIYLSGDGGVSWIRKNMGLELPDGSFPKVNVLRFTPDGDALVAGVKNRGLWYMEPGYPPVIDPPEAQSYFADRIYRFTVSASDPDGDSMSYDAQGLPAGAFMDGDEMVWDTTGAEGADIIVTFVVSDGLFTETADVNFTVVAPNNPPVLDPVDDLFLPVGQTVDITLTSSDADPLDPSIYRAENVPVWASFDPATAHFVGTPQAADVEFNPYTVTFCVSDGKEEVCDAATFTMNRAPSLDPVPDQQGTEGFELCFTFEGQDDPVDMDTLAYSSPNLPAWLTMTQQVVNDPVSGMDKMIATACGMPDPSGSPYSVTLMVSDQWGEPAPPQQMQITAYASANNTPPVFNPPITDQLLNDGSTLSLTLLAEDPDGDSITLYEVIQTPSWATFDPVTRTLTGTAPLAGANPVPSSDFTFRAHDDRGAYVEQAITIEVNARPLFGYFPDRTVNVGSAMADIDCTVTDPDPADLPVYCTVDESTLPPWASWAVNGTGVTVSGTPSDATGSPFEILFEADDGRGGLVSQTVEVIVNNIPVLDPIADQSVKVGKPLSITLSATDLDDDTLTYSAIGKPSWLKQNGATFSGTPYDDGGPYDVTFRVSDGIALDSQPVTITVTSAGSGGGGGGGGGGCFLTTVGNR
jgi:hypothetical protein